MMRLALGIFLLLSFSSHIFSQEVLNTKITTHTEGITYTSFFGHLRESHGLRIFYKEEFFFNEKIPIDLYGKTIEEAFNAIARYRELDYLKTDAFTIVFIYPDEPFSAPATAIPDVPKEPDVIIASPDGHTKQRCTLIGYLTDAQSGLPIIGGYIRTENESLGAVTDTDGKYELILPAGVHRLTYSALGYADEPLILRISYDGLLNVELYESVIKLSDIVIHGEKDNENILNTRMGTAMLEIETLNKLPSLMGDADVVKSVELLPGVTSVGEGSAGFNVRGGGTDQNLVLLQGNPVFNYSHFLGFFSAFNPDVVRNVAFYRGYIPAQYGGRISSVLDINLRDGNYKKLSGKGGVSLASGSALIEGPIRKDSTSFFLAGRGTYSDWLLNNFNDPNVQNSSAGFYDLNAKITHKIDWSKQISANFYYSQDKFNFLNDTIYNWRTMAASLIYQQALNEVFSLRSTLNKGQYSYLVKEPEPFQAFDLEYLIDYYVTNHHVSYDNSLFSATAGMEGTYYQINSGELTSREESEVNDFSLPESKALDLALFVQGETEPWPDIRISAGLRFSNFFKFSTDTVFTYQKNLPKSAETISDTLLTGSGPEQAYHGLEPRLGLTFVLSEQSSLKLSYTRTLQYIHLLSNTTAITPLDIWQTSGHHIKPQIGNQYSAGIYRNFKENSYETSAEVYFKTLDNVLEYKNGADLILNPMIETDLLQGKGVAYGVELLTKKTTGKLTGWFSYTFSRTFTRVNGDHPDERINDGYYYPANYDKPHNLKVFGSYKFNHRLTFNWNFQYSTGRPITVPVSKYIIDDVVINNFSYRNQYRIPDYHRLDIALDIFPNHRLYKTFESYWTLGLYNVYARKNAYSVFFEDTGENSVAKRLSVLGTIFPSISYNFKF